MLSSVDKAFAAFIVGAISYAVGSGWVTAEQAVSLTDIISTLVAAGVTALVTYLFPNKT